MPVEEVKRYLNALAIFGFKFKCWCAEIVLRLPRIIRVFPWTRKAWQFPHNLRTLSEYSSISLGAWSSKVPINSLIVESFVSVHVRNFICRRFGCSLFSQVEIKATGVPGCLASFFLFFTSNRVNFIYHVPSILSFFSTHYFRSETSLEMKFLGQSFREDIFQLFEGYNIKKKFSQKPVI